MSKERSVWRILEDIRIEDLPSEREQEALEFIRENFYKSALISTSVGVYKDPESMAIVEPDLSKCIRDNLCVAAVDTSTNQIVGITFLYIAKRGEVTNYGKLPPAYERATAILNAVEEKVNLFEEYTVDSLVSILRLCVKSSHTGRKLALNLVQVALEKAKNLGIPVAEMVCDCNASRNIAQKVGMKLWSELKYADFKFNGKVLIPNPGPNVSLVVMAMRL